MRIIMCSVDTVGVCVNNVYRKDIKDINEKPGIQVKEEDISDISGNLTKADVKTIMAGIEKLEKGQKYTFKKGELEITLNKFRNI